MGSHRTEGKRSSSCTWWERAPLQIVVCLVRDGRVSLPGKVVTVARQLGSHLGEKASFAHELQGGGKPR